MLQRRESLPDLLKEAKRRCILLGVCIIGLAYLLSLTSSSVWVNIPAALIMIVIFWSLSRELDFYKRQISGLRPLSDVSYHSSVQNLSPQSPCCNLSRSNSGWKKKVESPVVEAALYSFTGHLVREWLTDMWYSSLTPDKDAPAELEDLINGMIGEVAKRARLLNLIHLLTRDLVDVVRNELELFKKTQAQIGVEILNTLTLEERDGKLKLALIASRELHPGAFSPATEYKVLERLMGGLLAIITRPQDLECRLFNYLSRELLVCAVMRPVMNFARPAVLNELIVKSSKKKEAKVDRSGGKQSTSAESPRDPFSRTDDPLQCGVELVPLGCLASCLSSDISSQSFQAFSPDSKLDFPKVCCIGPKTTDEDLEDRVESYILNDRNIRPVDSKGCNREQCQGGRLAIPDVASVNEWGQMLKVISKRKSEALSPEHLENMWTKGRHYNERVCTSSAILSSQQKSKSNSAIVSSDIGQGIGDLLKPTTLNGSTDGVGRSCNYGDGKVETTPDTANQADCILGNNSSRVWVSSCHDASSTESSSTSEEDEHNGAEGLGDTTVKVWGTISSRHISNSKIRHPLEISESPRNRRNKTKFHRPKSTQLVSQQPASKSFLGLPSWQELERTSFSQGNTLDILNSVSEQRQEDASSSYVENIDLFVENRSAEDTSACSSTFDSRSSVTSIGPEVHSSSPFLQLSCHVVGAYFVRNGTKLFVVYSISVTNSSGHTWFLKRRFRHFEELHRCLKHYPEYAVSLPPKNFLQSSLDSSFVLKRCALLELYLQDLLSIPEIIESVELWDFLNAESQTYLFRNALSVVKKLTVLPEHEQEARSSGVRELIESNQSFGQVPSCNYRGTKHADDATRIRVRRNSTARASIDSAKMPISGISKPARRVSAMESLHNEERVLRCVHDDQLSVSQVTHSDTDSDMEGRKLELWSIETNEAAGGHEVLQKRRCLDKSIASLPDVDYSTNSFTDDLNAPLEWIPPKLTLPLLSLVDSIFELESRGWIRRQVFWMAKQILQLGMGDAFDDWILAKLQDLCRGEVIATTINWVEKILWPDGIFITKHQSQKSSAKDQKSPENHHHKSLEEEEQPLGPSECLKLVHELIVDKAPSALVALVGRKEYRRCAEDIYYFLQSTVFVKQLGYKMLEVVIVAAFPELQHLIEDVRNTPLSA